MTGLAVPALLLVAAPAALAAMAPPPTVQASKPVPVRPVQPNKARTVPMPAWHAPAPSWPAAGTATIALPASGSASAGRLPVRIGPAATAVVTPATVTSAVARTASVTAATVEAALDGTAVPVPSGVTVSMRSQQAAAAAGVKGVLFTVRGADGAGGRVRLSLDDGSFAYAYGGGYAARLRLVELPGCALTTPQDPACRVQTPLGSSDDVRTGQLAADVTVPAATTAELAAGASAPEVVLAATASTSGSGGDYTATPLSEAGTWRRPGRAARSPTRTRSPCRRFPAAWSPTSSLDYDSQAVDGLTSSTNDQASWIGDGWDYSAGLRRAGLPVVRRTSRPARPTGPRRGDLCWSVQRRDDPVAQRVDTTLVQDSSTGAWHAESATGRRSVETGTTNGTNDGDYWVVTTPDGTSYYFGLNELPGCASGDAATNSAWTTPVFATSPASRATRPPTRAPTATRRGSGTWTT